MLLLLRKNDTEFSTIDRASTTFVLGGRKKLAVPVSKRCGQGGSVAASSDTLTHRRCLVHELLYYSYFTGPLVSRLVQVLSADVRPFCRASVAAHHRAISCCCCCVCGLPVSVSSPSSSSFTQLYIDAVVAQRPSITETLVAKSSNSVKRRMFDS